MEQPRQAFIEVNLQKGTVGSLRFIAKMQQQSVELQLNKQPRKLLLLSGLILRLLLVTFTMFDF